MANSKKTNQSTRQPASKAAKTTQAKARQQAAPKAKKQVAKKTGAQPAAKAATTAKSAKVPAVPKAAQAAAKGGSGKAARRTKTRELRLFQTMAGASHGGAEIFFERLALSFQLEGVNQQLMTRADSERMKRLKAGGVQVERCSFSNVLGPLHRRRIAGAMKRSRANVVLSWMNRATAMTPSTRATHVGRLGGFYDLKHYQNCNWLVANTRDVADYLVKEGWRAKRVHLLHNFAPDGSLSPNFDGPDGERPIIASAGRLHHNKAFDTLIKAFAKLGKGTLWIAGDGPEDSKLRELARELGVEQRVVFLGWQQNAQSVMRSADIFVCPSRHEPWGNVIPEAMSCARPVIATATNGAREIIKNGKNGLIAPIDDVNALADRIDEVTSDSGLARKLAMEGRNTWKLRLSRTKVTKDWIEFLTSVAS